MNNLSEQAFEKWKERNEKALLASHPATVGFNGAAGNFSHWCRQVYTGRIKLDIELK